MPSINTSRLSICSLIVFFIFFCNANAASFDCAKASTQQEKAVCANPTLSALDDKLAESYRNARAVSQDPAKLKSEQIEWIKEVRKCAVETSCIERLYTSRLSELNPQPVKPTMAPVASAAPIDASAPAVEVQASATQPSASAIAEAPAAPVESAVVPLPAPVALEEKVVSVEPNASIFSNPDYQRYALIAFGGILTLIAAYFLFKYLISLAKRTALKASSAARAGVTKLSEEADSLKEGLSNKAKDISSQAKARASDLATDFNKEGGIKDQIKARASDLATDFNKEGGVKDQIKSMSEKSFDRLSKAGSDIKQEDEEINYVRVKFEKVNDTTIKTLESVETVNPEIRKVIESLGGKVKSATSSEIEASFRYGINFYGIIISVKIHSDNNETFIEIKGFFKDSIDNGAAALKAAEILSSLTGDIEQKKYIESPKGISENLTSKVKIAYEAYIVLFKKSPWIVGILSLAFIGMLLPKGGTVSSEYKPGTDYVYFSDGSCKNNKERVCIDVKQAQYLCDNSSGVTNYLYDNLKYGNLGDRAATLFKDGSVGAFNYSWNGRQCSANISAEGLYQGTSAKARLSGYVHTFMIDKDQKALVHGAFLSLD
jgi:uncharacterized protein